MTNPKDEMSAADWLRLAGRSNDAMMERFLEIENRQRAEEAGPYALAEYDFEYNRDHDLWVRCLVQARQNEALAKSYYIETVAEAFIAGAERERAERESEVRDDPVVRGLHQANLIHRREADPKRRRARWLTRELGFWVGGVIGLVVALSGDREIGAIWQGLLLGFYIGLSTFLGGVFLHYTRMLLIFEYRKGENWFSYTSWKEQLVLLFLTVGSWLVLTIYW